VVTATDLRSSLLDLMQALLILRVPVLNEAGRPITVHLLRKLLGRIDWPNAALILAGGRGTRLLPVTDQSQSRWPRWPVSRFWNRSSTTFWASELAVSCFPLVTWGRDRAPFWRRFPVRVRHHVLGKRSVQPFGNRGTLGEPLEVVPQTFRARAGYERRLSHTV